MILRAERLWRIPTLLYSTGMHGIMTGFNSGSSEGDRKMVSRH
jgi:hypothetical protein